MVKFKMVLCFLYTNSVPMEKHSIFKATIDDTRSPGLKVLFISPRVNEELKSSK